jgi:hypothetical protein
MEEEFDDNHQLSGAEVWPDPPEDSILDEAPGPFEERAVEYLRRELPTQTSGLSDEQLQERILSCAGRCSAYGLSSEEQLIYFVTTSYLLEEYFDSGPEYAWTAEVLQDPEMSADERAAMLVALAETLVEEQRS